MLLIAAIIGTGDSRFSAVDSGGNPKPALIHLKEGEKRVSRQRQAAVLLKADPVTTGSRHFVVGSEDLDPGERINVHRHEMEDELLILYKGVVTVTLGDQRLAADAGTTVFVPTGTWIGVENSGKETATVFFLFPEIGAEDWFRQVMVAEGEDRTPLSKEKLEELKRKHRIVFQAPNL